MTRFYAWFLVLLAALATGGVAWSRGEPAPPAPEPGVTRHLIFWQGARVGSMESRTFSVTHQDKPALRSESHMRIKMTALDQVIEQDVRTTQLTDESGRPVTTHLVMSSSGRTTTIRARFEADRVVCAVDAGGQESTTTLPIPRGANLIVDPQGTSGRGESLTVGRKDRFHFFEPITLTLPEMTSEVLKQQQREIGGRSVPTWLVRTEASVLGVTESWVDSAGELLESSSSGGIRMVRDDLLEVFPATGEPSPALDLGDATSVKTEVRIPDPRRTRSLRLRISGIPEARLVLSDSRQQVTHREGPDGALKVTYQLAARPLPETGLPLVKPGTGGPHLDDAPYLGLDDPAIRRQGEALAAEGGDRVAVARCIRAWVYGHLKPSNIGTLRSAPEILRSRDGVCRDYATLAAALARVAGIPARVCSGIVYHDDGFYYHAWVELQLTEGEEGWHPLDPTLEHDFVDATHVKFAQGDPAEMFASVRLIGLIQAEILDHR
ncbi:MAG: transglutaminase-like domain-containing protein [Armatimonadota bacterium]